MPKDVTCTCEAPSVTGEVRAILRETGLVLRGAVSMKVPLSEIADVRGGVFGLSFVYADALYRLRMSPAEAVEWAARFAKFREKAGLG